MSHEVDCQMKFTFIHLFSMKIDLLMFSIISPLLYISFITSVTLSINAFQACQHLCYNLIRPCCFVPLSLSADLTSDFNIMGSSKFLSIVDSSLLLTWKSSKFIPYIVKVIYFFFSAFWHRYVYHDDSHTECFLDLI